MALKPDAQYIVFVHCRFGRGVEAGVPDIVTFMGRMDSEGRLRERRATPSTQQIVHTVTLANRQGFAITDVSATIEAVEKGDLVADPILVFSRDLENNVNRSLPCKRRFFLYGDTTLYANALLAGSATSSGSNFVSAAATLVTTLAATASGITPFAVKPSEKVTDAAQIANDVVAAGQVFSTALAGGFIDNPTQQLREGKNIVRTGFSEVHIYVERVEDYLLNDQVPFRDSAAELLEQFEAAWDKDAAFLAALRKPEIVEADYDTVADGCVAMNEDMKDAGLYSTLDRGYLLAKYLKGKRARKPQKILCHHESELTDIMFDEKALALLAGSKKGLGRRAVFYADDYKVFCVTYEALTDCAE